MRRAIQVVRHMGKDGDLEQKKKRNALQQDLAKKEQDLEDLESLSQALIIKERKSNDEVQQARKELINGLMGQSAWATIGIKTMGDLDSKQFHTAAKRKYGKKADRKAMKLCSPWDAYPRDPSWHPFKIIRGSDKEEVLHFHSGDHFRFSFCFSPWDSAMYFCIMTSLLDNFVLVIYT
ncbi:factor of DNA methylation 1-like isoform X1 [Rhododendron vialii]|uniref:factor of DNA methylation 1-like isoform X1 n=1 Tax=Rhododendron vialii TaxID=182163 RepID=UPI00265E1434|nr:factor of DNA methylation 1-like isoform X1 [Rhododendron vialii]